MAKKKRFYCVLYWFLFNSVSSNSHFIEWFCFLASSTTRAMFWEKSKYLIINYMDTVGARFWFPWMIFADLRIIKLQTVDLDSGVKLA